MSKNDLKIKITKDQKKTKGDLHLNIKDKYLNFKSERKKSSSKRITYKGKNNCAEMSIKFGVENTIKQEFYPQLSLHVWRTEWHRQSC